MSLIALQKKILPKIETELQSFLEAQAFGSSQELKEMIAYHMGWRDKSGTGKRIRPLLTLLCAGALESKLETAMPAAIAIEFLHNFTLIHDDLEDQSPLRHGRKTVWQRWGNAQAINAGDALFSIAQVAMLDLTRTCDNVIALQAAERLNQVCLHLTRGQYLDIAFEKDDHIPLETYLEMINGKTAALVGFSTAMGGLVARQEPGTIQLLSDFGNCLGKAFQIKDDILGIWGNSKVTGKSTTSDLLAKKKSLPILYGLRESPEFRSLWFAGKITPNQVKPMSELLENCGARAYASTEAENVTNEAFRIFEKIFPGSKKSSQYSTAIFELCGDLLTRNM